MSCTKPKKNAGTRLDWTKGIHDNGSKGFRRYKLSTKTCTLLLRVATTSKLPQNIKYVTAVGEMVLFWLPAGLGKQQSTKRIKNELRDHMGNIDWTMASNVVLSAFSIVAMFGLMKDKLEEDTNHGY